MRCAHSGRFADRRVCGARERPTPQLREISVIVTRKSRGHDANEPPGRREILRSKAHTNAGARIAGFQLVGMMTKATEATTVKVDSNRVVREFQAAYVALRRAGRDDAHVSLPYVPVLLRRDLRKPRGSDVWLSRQAAPAASVQFARLRAAWNMLPDGARAKAHLILALERAV